MHGDRDTLKGAEPPPRAAVCLGVTRCYISRLLELRYTIRQHRHSQRGARYQSPWWLVIALNNLQQSSGLILYHSRDIWEKRGGKAEDVWWQPSSVGTQGGTIVSSLEVTLEVRATPEHGPFSPHAEAQQDTCRRHPAEPSVNSKAPTPRKHPHVPPPPPPTTTSASRK